MTFPNDENLGKILCMITEYEMNKNWKKYYYGRCVECGNGYDKEDWRFEKQKFNYKFPDTDFEEIGCIAYDNQQQEGNGICFKCACEIKENNSL